jgi:4-hydroxy-tetrahydrodipicolinate synthase
MSMGELRGTGVALVTPFDEQNNIDLNGLDNIIDNAQKGSIDFLVLLGTTAEAPTLSKSEKHQIIRHVSGQSRLPLVIGCGGNNTQQVIEEMRELDEYKPAAFLSVVPYYNRPSQGGLLAHFTAIASSCKTPIMLYNVPFRTASNLEANTTIKLSKHPGIIGIKEASNDIKQVQAIINGSDDDFMVWSGDDAMTYDILRAGGDGAISVLANYNSIEFCDMVAAALESNWEKAAKIHYQLKEQYKLMSLEGNPVSVKTGLEAKGLINRRVRLPLVGGSVSLLTRFK